jgi:hypothetical protein
MTATLGVLRRILSRQAVDRSSLRAGGDPYAVPLATPRVWVALG